MGFNKIVIGSVLKPVDDTRMFEKFGASLVQTTNYDVNIVGFYSKTKSNHPQIHFHPVFGFRRLSVVRLFAGFRFLSILFKLSPQICIVTTFELLPAALTYKLITGCRLVYDVQENYYRNILYTSHAGWGIRQLAAGLVRVVEKVSSWGVDRFILAEKCYSNEMGFVSRSYTIIENKYQPMTLRDRSSTRTGFSLLYSGTIALPYGIFEAIELFTKLYQLDHRYRLTLAGYCPHSRTRERLNRVIAETPNLTAVGIDHLVPHSVVLDYIREADFGIVAYRPNPATANCLPTRIYEYLGNNLPMVLPQNPLWADLCQLFHAGFSIDFEDYDPEDIHSQIQNGSYYPGGNDGDIYWQTEAIKLLSLLSELDS